MNGNRTGVPNPPVIIAADNRVPFPHTDQKLRCRTEPVLFAIEDIHDSDADRRTREKAIAEARRDCSGCPIVVGCLKWALANPDLTPHGIWAPTMPRERTELREKLVARLGEDWVGVVAAQERRRKDQERAARFAPPTVRDPALARLEREAIPTRPTPYNRWKQPITPAQAASHRHVLELVASGKAA
ncbi:WhiB family transcriptional regulator [Streptomyces candidus]|uniref:WhiB family redox-sensing transcriptional regulator n=1 Tax=Streptomyces candidus TaxID=67283 RepID=A0A7X0HMI5_9ACTN|nr:WhiB family transcriptional regulator [Streptomyces candidus]MBB6439102.1 WhiB family redox-sensing transcriptional regulator [Streptomyces candidus]GHH55648.1 hypothetical protein GCM10018773_60430 [Streptomyces candidus]